MEISFILLIVLGIAAIIYISLGIKSHQHKGVAIFLILLFLVAIYGFKVTFGNTNVQIRNIQDVKDAIGLYFSWFGNLFSNLKTISTNAVNLDWEGNQTT
jgi:uncharacterized membrane protein